MQEFIDRLGREGCWNVEMEKIYWEGRMLFNKIHIRKVYACLEFIGRLGREGCWNVEIKIILGRFNKIHIRKVYACLAVTCHLHFWQNDGDILRATVVTRGWNGYRNKSQHRKSTLEKKILPPFQQGFEPATFQSRALTTELSPPPYWGGKDAGIYRQTGERGVLECRNKNILGGKDAGIYRQTGERGVLECRNKNILGGKDAGIYRQTGERGVLECRNKNILGGKDAGIYRQTGERGVLECRNILGREGCRNL